MIIKGSLLLSAPTVYKRRVELLILAQNTLDLVFFAWKCLTTQLNVY